VHLTKKEKTVEYVMATEEVPLLVGIKKTGNGTDEGSLVSESDVANRIHPEFILAFPLILNGFRKSHDVYVK